MSDIEKEKKSCHVQNAKDQLKLHCMKFVVEKRLNVRLVVQCINLIQVLPAT